LTNSIDTYKLAWGEKKIKKQEPCNEMEVKKT